MNFESTLTQDLQARGDPATSAFLYRVLDAEAPRKASGRHRLQGLDTVLFGRGEALAGERVGAGLQLAIADRWMSSHHARLTRVMRSWMLEDTKSKNGVVLNGEPIERAELHDGDVFELGRTFFLFRASQPAGAVDVESGALTPPHPGLATLQPQLEERFAELARIAASNVTVALSGASGTGKEVVARALHALSRRGGPFVAVNCGALPDELVESELFGHRKGAFSGALEDRAGLVRSAHGGTLLLDEVGDLPLSAQPALLRVLQERQVLPVGGTTPLPVDARVLSATHRSLEALTTEGAFRDDLRARLSGYQLSLPTLQERREDLGLIIATLLSRLGAGAKGARLSLEAARALMLHAWPLNVRELEKALETAVVLAGAGTIELEHLPTEVREAKGRPGSRSSASPDQGDAARQAQLEALLREHRGNVSAVARDLGKARMQIQRWMARYGLDPTAFKS